MDAPLILSTQNGRVLTLTLNRPEAMNALNSELMSQLINMMKIADNNPEISVIILTGSERAFAAGADIKEMQTLTYADVIKNDFAANYISVSKIRKPIIAAVNGFALGGGLELVMMCDMIIGSNTSKYGQPEINLGVMPGIGGSQRLTRLVGRAKAMDMCLTGRIIGAEEAHVSGLISRIFDTSELLLQVQEIAAEMAKKSLPALTYIKEAIHRSEEISLQEGLLFERRLFHMCFGLEDKLEGMTAFLEKRPATFKNK